MTTSAKHIWTRTANRREPAKAIFFSNQIVFLIMFLFLPKLLIRHLEDFLWRGKCNKLVCFSRSLLRQGMVLPAVRAARPMVGSPCPMWWVLHPWWASSRGMCCQCRGAAHMCCCSVPRATAPSKTDSNDAAASSPGRIYVPLRPFTATALHPLLGSVCAAEGLGNPVFAVCVSPSDLPPEHRERNYNWLWARRLMRLCLTQ